MKESHYGAIDGLRTYSVIGIALMHVRANSAYEISGFWYDTFIGAFGHYTLLFMMISAFCMCCGYYQPILENRIRLQDFYKRRYRRVLPFFSLIVLLELLTAPSFSALCETLADVTLTNGFLSEFEITVVGVGWFLGVVFLFYLLFPFFCFLCETRKRAWLAFFVSLLLNATCIVYFHVGRTNILADACYFLAGGLIFLYRRRVAELPPKSLCVLLPALCVSAYAFYCGDFNAPSPLRTLVSLALYSLLLILALGNFPVFSIGGGIGQSLYALFRRNQYGSLPLPYAGFSHPPARPSYNGIWRRNLAVLRYVGVCFGGRSGVRRSCQAALPYCRDMRRSG